MNRAEAEIVMEYCADIPRKLRIIKYRRAELNDEISSLRGMNLDGMPRGSQPGDSTAAMASKMEDLGISEELKRVDREEAVLRADESKIKEKLYLDGRLHRQQLAPGLQEGGAVGVELLQDALHRHVEDTRTGS